MSIDDSDERTPEELQAHLQELWQEYQELWGDLADQRIRADLTGLLLGRSNPVHSSKGHAEVAAAPDLAHSFPKILARCPKMMAVFELISKVAPTDTTVLIQGESGTGKELIARALHDLSRRKGKPYVAENCAALPETLLETELFGHQRGAFTGADRNRKGRFSAADTGTLFLDEVGDMSPNLQKKLLRALQEGEIRPVGSSKTIKVDVRFISASNKDLVKLTETGQFREDLFYRLAPVRIQLPPLREREGDVLLLAESFAGEIARRLGLPGPPGFEPEVLKALQSYSWPGNVRELQNEMQRCLALNEPGQPISLRDLSPDIQKASTK